MIDYGFGFDTGYALGITEIFQKYDDFDHTIITEKYQKVLKCDLPYFSVTELGSF